MSSSLDIISSRELPEYDDLCCFRCQGAQAGHAAAAASGSDQHETSSDDNRTWCTFFEYSAQSVPVHAYPGMVQSMKLRADVSSTMRLQLYFDPPADAIDAGTRCMR